MNVSTRVEVIAHRSDAKTAGENVKRFAVGFELARTMRT